MKAILEIDMPKNCSECELTSCGECVLLRVYIREFGNCRHDNCPLKAIE